jgi:hypothetical protein
MEVSIKTRGKGGADSGCNRYGQLERKRVFLKLAAKPFANWPTL